MFVLSKKLESHIKGLPFPEKILTHVPKIYVNMIK